MLEKYDNSIKIIINRLENDIKRITETIENKKEDNYGHIDDYTKIRLKAYRTKTKEIKGYIEKICFGKGENNENRE